MQQQLSSHGLEIEAARINGGEAQDPKTHASVTGGSCSRQMRVRSRLPTPPRMAQLRLELQALG